MVFANIENNHLELINKAKEYMNQIKDSEHNINHMNDVVEYTKKIIQNINEDIDYEVCLIGAYWHDVGRIKIQDGHEKISVQMLTETMRNMKYDEDFIKKCSDSIEFHKWNMTPKTKEGLVIKDADKIAWLGIGRWKSCIKEKHKLNNIVELLPELRNNILYFEYSKKIYDEEVIKVIQFLYNKI